MWNSSQAEALFAFSKSKGLTAASTLFGFELGEELTSFKAGTAAFDAYTKSYHAAAALLRSIFGDDDAERPQLMGKPPQYRCRLGAFFSRRQRYCYWQARARGCRGRSWTSGTRPS